MHTIKIGIFAGLFFRNINEMLSKKEVKYIQSLCHKRQRDEDKVFIAEGPKLAEEILKSDFKLLHVYALKEWIEANPQLVILAIEITPSELERISQLKTPNQVLVVAQQKILENEPSANDQLTLVLDGIQDPGNLGTIIRIADWFGIKQMVLSSDCADIYNPKVVQSTMGSIGRVACWYKSLNHWLTNVRVPVYGALLSGESVFDVSAIKEGILVIGNESKGIRNDIINYISKPVTIPKTGGAESLNAAVATGIILSHLISR
jgi:TrmH family RNA methyltransferase